MLNRTSLLIIFLTALALVGLYSFATDRPATVAAEVAIPPAAAPAAAAASQNTITVLGTFVAPTQATLAFKGGGRLSEVRVQEGAQVKKGDTLAVLETTELQIAVQQAKAAGAAAQAGLTSARAALAGAQARLSLAKNATTSADTAAAQAAVDAALQTYEKVRAGPTPNDLMGLKAQVDNAKAALDQAQAAYDRVGGATNPYIGQLPQSLQLQAATNNYSAALAAYNNARAHPTAAELAGAWAQVQQAQDALARLTPNADSVAAAQAAVDQAQAGVDQVQASVDQAQAALALAQQQVTNATLTAPFDGTVIWLGPHAGESVTPATPMLTLADLTHLQFQVGVDENSLGAIQVGQRVSIRPQAFKDKSVTGQVARIGWIATTTAGVINVPVVIDVDPGAVPLRPGLTATADIQIPGQ